MLLLSVLKFAAAKASNWASPALATNYFNQYLLLQESNSGPSTDQGKTLPKWWQCEQKSQSLGNHMNSFIFPLGANTGVVPTTTCCRVAHDFAVIQPQKPDAPNSSSHSYPMEMTILQGGDFILYQQHWFLVWSLKQCWDHVNKIGFLRPWSLQAKIWVAVLSYLSL